MVDLNEIKKDIDETEKKLKKKKDKKEFSFIINELYSNIGLVFGFILFMFSLGIIFGFITYSILGFKKMYCKIKSSCKKKNINNTEITMPDITVAEDI